jgi:hypothetical protein
MPILPLNVCNASNNLTAQQFKEDLSAAFSSLGTVPHNYRHIVYGGACAVPGLYREAARAISIEHRRRTATKPKEATHDIDQELKDPT